MAVPKKRRKEGISFLEGALVSGQRVFEASGKRIASGCGYVVGEKKKGEKALLTKGKGRKKRRKEAFHTG